MTKRILPSDGNQAKWMVLKAHFNLRKEDIDRIRKGVREGAIVNARRDIGLAKDWLRLSVEFWPEE